MTEFDCRAECAMFKDGREPSGGTWTVGTCQRCAIGMEFGLFFELSVARPFADGVERAVYDNALEQVRLADALGFHAVWAVEHHFLEEYSHCSAPEVFLTACAVQTQRIRVGHG